jgi:hypothetical protein|tara:strand:- start:1946 stop:2203 length:258 start_codon:yes stop_codon:yes gene_type:complete
MNSISQPYETPIAADNLVDIFMDDTLLARTLSIPLGIDLIKDEKPEFLASEIVTAPVSTISSLNKIPHLILVFPISNNNIFGELI